MPVDPLLLSCYRRGGAEAFLDDLARSANGGPAAAPQPL